MEEDFPCPLDSLPCNCGKAECRYWLPESEHMPDGCLWQGMTRLPTPKATLKKRESAAKAKRARAARVAFLDTIRRDS